MNSTRSLDLHRLAPQAAAAIVCIFALFWAAGGMSIKSPPADLAKREAPLPPGGQSSSQLLQRIAHPMLRCRRAG